MFAQQEQGLPQAKKGGAVKKLKRKQDGGMMPPPEMMQQQQMQNPMMGQAPAQDPMQQVMMMVQQMMEQGAAPEDVVMELLNNQVPPDVIVQVFVQMGIPQEQAVQIIQGVMSQEQGMPEQGMDPSMMQGQGMTPDMMPAMDPGMAMMQMGGASSDDSLIEEILNALNQGANPEEVIGFLVEQGMPEQEAMQTVMQLVQSSNSQTQPTMYKGGELPKAQVGYTFPTTFKTFGEPVRVAETDQLTGVETVQSSRPGSGFGAQVQDINKFMNTHAWYFGKLSEEEKTKFINEVKSGKESTLVKNFQKAYNNLLTDEAKKRKLPDAEITKIIEEIGFSDKGPRKLDGKFGAFTSSRPYFNFNVIEDKVDDKDDPKNKLKDKLKANAVDRGDINVPDIQGVRAPDVAEWTATDINNFIGAVRDKQSIKSYFPYADRFSPEFMDPTMYDPSRELAAQAEQANILTQGMGQFVGPQALSARASQVQGQGAKGAADILSKYNNLNVGLANQFDAQNVQLANQAQQYNQAKAQELYDKGVITQQQRDNANRQADAVIRQGFAQGWKNASDIAMLNANQEQYKVDPYTGTVFHTGVQRPFDPVKQQADYYELLQKNMNILNDPGAAVSATNAQLRSSSGTPAYAKGGYVLGANVFPPMFY
jgi:ribosomal protein S16